MEKVFVLTCDWDCGDGRENQILGVFAEQESAEQEMKEFFEQDKIDSVFADYFENGKLKDDAKNDGIVLDEEHDRIYIFDNY